jgi:hypothetical protein
MSDKSKPSEALQEVLDVLASYIENTNTRFDHLGRDFVLGRASVFEPFVRHVAEYRTIISPFQINGLSCPHKPKTPVNTSTCVCGVNPIIGDECQGNVSDKETAGCSSIGRYGGAAGCLRGGGEALCWV